MKNPQLAPKGTFYFTCDELAKKDSKAFSEYMWTDVDGKPRFRWYKNVVNIVELLEKYDFHFDIEKLPFKDFEDYFKSIEWVMQNDPDSLIYIMSQMITPVSEKVKNKILSHLIELEYYHSCAVIQKHLQVKSTSSITNREFQKNRAKGVTK
ncbi:hypothetical protein [Carboxylicivirga linearis]|uniref:Uncharacterized protein n=1 Tax=Carboxylicivirga linearis TaxID=1628157 RepID=A0ABS5JWS3_9BACT|nr:hypothetical protein [Carboxylicivirga linearis]MBS2098801.1 hypothetical protein [Carboxylicivirga linearis]